MINSLETSSISGEWLLVLITVIASLAVVLIFSLNPFSRYKRQSHLITKIESESFNYLEPIVAQYGCRLFAQVRIADVISVSGSQGRSWWRAFTKISSKHVDFVVVDSRFRILCCIEIDDVSHKRKDRKKRDAFVNKVFSSAGLTLLRCEPKKESRIVEKLTFAILEGKRGK